MDGLGDNLRCHMNKLDDDHNDDVYSGQSDDDDDNDKYKGHTTYVLIVVETSHFVRVSATDVIYLLQMLDK